MQRVEQHYIGLNNPNYQQIDDLCFKSKNLYNYANYIIRQEFISNKQYINYNQLDKILQKEESYQALPSKVSQQTLKLLDKNWQNFFASIKDWKINPNKYKCKPNIPKYLDKVYGRYQLIYTKQAIKKNNILSKTNIEVKTKKDIQQVRITVKSFGYFIEVVYNKEGKEQVKESKNHAHVDLGLNNLVTLTSNLGNNYLVNGRILKSINHHFNKQKSKIKSKNKLKTLSKKRYFRITNYFHHVSKFILKYCLFYKIGVLVIGYNQGWKQKINIGKVNNQNFCFLPFLELIKQIVYKLEEVGIKVVLTEEAYTSQASCLDNDLLPKYGKEKPVFSGKRIKRGLYQAKDGTLVNADVNGSYNVGRKVINFTIDKSLVARPLKINPLLEYSFS